MLQHKEFFLLCILVLT